MNKNVDLAELMRLLLEEEGLTEEEAGAVVVATIKARRSQELQRRNSQVMSVQDHPNRVDYGDETPAQAKERWMAQELADPNGLFGGGATAGGVFGDGPVSLDGFDPGAVRREVELRTMLSGVQTQQAMLELMQEMRRELRNGGNHQRQLPRPVGGSAFSRVLGKKKR